MAFTPLLPAAKLSLPVDWTESSWGPVANAADRLSSNVIDIARAGLRRAFPTRLRRVLEEERHPVVARQFTYPGRARLLEVGLAAAMLPADAEDIRRLRHSEEFPSCATELISGWMFRRKGAAVLRPPKIKRRKRCDYIWVSAQGSSYAVEVKRLERSAQIADLEPAFVNVMFELQRCTSWMNDVVLGGEATFQMSSAIRDLGYRGAVDFEELRARCHAASEHLQESLRRGTASGTFELTGLGTVIITPDSDSTSLAWDFEFPPTDPTQNERRVERAVERAIEQVRDAKLPGIIVLDVEEDGLARNALGSLAEWARRSRGLAAVFVMERHSFANGSCCAAVDVLPGAEFEEASDEVLSVLELCDGHFHYSPLNALVLPCPLAAWRS